VTETKDKANVLILDDHVVTSKLCAATGIGKLVVMKIISKIGYKRSAQHRCCTYSQSNKKQPDKTSVQNFSNSVRKTERDAFLSRIITADEK
jgi:hypothetical protein